jgi:hypothetical protein
MVAGVLWLWVNRDPVKCFLAMMLTLAGWLARVNTANDVINTIQSSSLFGTIAGAKVYREMLGWLVGDCSRRRRRRTYGVRHRHRGHRHQTARGMDAGRGRRRDCRVAALPAALLDAIVLLFVPWQAAVRRGDCLRLTWQNGVRNCPRRRRESPGPR